MHCYHTVLGGFLGDFGLRVVLLGEGLLWGWGIWGDFGGWGGLKPYLCGLIQANNKNNWP